MTQMVKDFAVALFVLLLLFVTLMIGGDAIRNDGATTFAWLQNAQQNGVVITLVILIYCSVVHAALNKQERSKLSVT